MINRPKNAAANVTAAPPAQPLRRRTLGLAVGGVVALGIAVIYIVGLIGLIFQPPSPRQSGHVRTGLIIVLGLLVFLCMAIAFHLFRLACAIVPPRSGQVRDDPAKKA
jgi:hypothetical protein